MKLCFLFIGPASYSSFLLFPSTPVCPVGNAPSILCVSAGLPLTHACSYFPYLVTSMNSFCWWYTYSVNLNRNSDIHKNNLCFPQHPSVNFLDLTEDWDLNSDTGLHKVTALKVAVGCTKHPLLG